MTEFRTVTEFFSVSPQLGPEDVARAKAEGFVLLINNRPEGEEPGQTPGAEIEALARAAGLDYVAIPIIGGPAPAQARAQVQAAADTGGRVLAYCRSGTRSINTWALGQVLTEAQTRVELIKLGAMAGYDLRPLLG